MPSPELYRRVDQGGQEIEPTLKTKIMFAGQGRRIEAVCRQIIALREHPIAQERLNQADEILYDLYPQEFPEGITPIISNGTDTDRRKYQQPILFLNDIVCLAIFLDQCHDINITGFAGYSFGTVTAAYASGAIKDQSNALRFVIERPRVVAETNEEIPGKLRGFGVNHADERLVSLQEEFGTETSIKTSNRFTVIGGAIEAVDLTAQKAESLGIKTYDIPDNDAAYHTSLMKGAVPRLETVLKTIEIQNAHSSVITNNARTINRPGQVKRELSTHIAETSDWQHSARSIITNRNTEQLVEIGNPTGILSGHLQRDLEDQYASIKREGLKKNPIKVAIGATALAIGTLFPIRVVKDSLRA